MAAIAPQSVVLNGQPYVAFPNRSLKHKDGSDKSSFDHLVEYTKSSNGSFRCLQLLDRVSRLAGEILKYMGNSMAGFCKSISSTLSTAWGTLVLTRLPEVTASAKKAIMGWINGRVTANSGRDTAQRVHDVAEAAASWGYAGSLVTLGNATLRNAAEGFNLVSDVTALSMAAQDFSLAKRTLEKIQTVPGLGETGDVQRRLVDTMRYAMLRSAKEVCSVASGVIGLAVLAFGGPLLPAVALILISLSSTVLSMGAHFFKETSPFEMVDFFKNRHPEFLVGGAAAI